MMVTPRLIRECRQQRAETQIMAVAGMATTDQSFIAELLSKSDSPHRLLESLSNALSLGGNAARADVRLVTDKKTNSAYVSCIYCNGKRLLPPRLSETDRIEMAGIRERALLVEKRVAQRKENAMRRLLSYVGERLKQLECRETVEANRKGNGVERSQLEGKTDQLGVLPTHQFDERNCEESDEEQVGKDGDSRQHLSVSVAMATMVNLSKASPGSVSWPRSKSITISTDCLEEKPQVDTNDTSMTSLTQFHSALPCQTVHSSITKTTSPSSYFSPNQSRTTPRISPRRRLNLDGSTDEQYEQMVLTSRSPLAAAKGGSIRNSEKLYAIALGHLTRKLYRSSKVQQLATTMRDLSAFLHNSSPAVSRHTHDSILRDQVKSQLQAARSAVHSIFFIYGPREQIALMAHSRQVAQERTFRQSSASSEQTVRLSVATQKARERRERLKENPAMLPTKPQPTVKQATPSVPSHKVKPMLKSKSTPRRGKPASAKSSRKTIAVSTRVTPSGRNTKSGQTTWK